MSQPQNSQSISSILEEKKQAISSHSFPATVKPSVERAARYIHEHLFDPQLTVDRLLDECEIAGNTFSQRFRMRMGHTPHDYIQRHRIEAACSLFTHGIDNVFRVGLSVGYARYRTFLRNFKAIVGCTPSEFIRQHASPERETTS
jgi:AraC family transcriptional regulator